MTTPSTPRFEFRDIFDTWVPITLEALRTTRKGERVTRYRWKTAAGSGVGWGSPFTTVEGAVEAARRRPAVFREIA